MKSQIYQRIRSLIVVPALFSLCAPAIGQHMHGDWCASGRDHLHMMNTDPDYARNFDELNTLVASKVEEAKRIGGVGNFGVVTIPVVVHIVYNPSMVGQNITDNKVNEQINLMNQDFRRLNADTIHTPLALRQLGGDVEIEFRLARIDPDGNPTNGITRTSTTRTDFGGTSTPSSTRNDVKRSANGGKDPWPTNRYLNMWVCNFVADAGNQLLGYAQFPGGNPATDGIVIWYPTVGNNPPTYLGRTTTHELGHWLGLIHIWGDGSGCGPSFPGSDLVEDTPPQSEPSSGVNCPGGPSAVRTDVCSPVSPGYNYQNYMDYSSDNCMNMFTKGQVERMRSALDISRVNLKTTGFLTGPPVPLKTYDATIFKLIAPTSGNAYCQTTVAPRMIIRNYGTNTFQRIKLGYIIDDGVPYDSMYQVPNINGFLQSYQWETFTMAPFEIPSGASKVKIYCAMPQDSTDLDNTNDTVIIDFAPNPAPTYFAKYSQGFEGGRFLPTQWEQKNGTARGFEKASVGGFGQSATSVVRRFYNDPASLRSTDTLFMPLVDITNAKDSLYLYYSYAYGRRTGGSFSNDSLDIMISTDCGQTYLSLKARGGSSLATVAINVTQPYVPQGTHWIRDSISLTGYVNQFNKIRIAFVAINGKNNNLYLDDFLIDGPGVEFRQQPIFPEAFADGFFQIYPNPLAGNILNVVFGEPVAGSFDILIFDALGKTLMKSTISGNNGLDFAFDIRGLAEGLYFVDISSAGKRERRKLVVSGP